MGETTCVMHAFSYSSALSNDANEDNNPIFGMEESVSLGKFMSESLSWEKWSSFSRNRYVEEAEMYSRPGSVKQKKAYFEAHFKRMAALKAAALLEQENTVKGVGVTEKPKLQTQVHSAVGIKVAQDPASSSPTSIMDQQWADKEDESSDVVANCNEDESNDGDDQLRSQVFGETDQDELEELFMDVEEQNPSAEIESDSAKEVDVFHDCVVDKEVEEDSGFVADHYQNDGDYDVNTKIIEETDEQAVENVELKEQLIDVEKQNPSAQMESDLAKIDKSHFECSNTNQDNLEATSPLSTFIPSPPMKNPSLSSYMPSVEDETSPLISSSPPAKSQSVAQPSAVHPGKENTFTPIGRKSWINDPDKKRTPLRMSINRLISPVIKKIGSSSRASNKDFSTPLKTPAKASVDGMANGPPEMTPQSGKRRARALFDSSNGSGSKADRPRWQFLSKEGSKSPSRGRSKASSPIIPKSFCLSTSRAPRRKERLEEKFNAKATESIQQQSKLKEKPKEVTKLRQSFCFGAKLSSESFREQQERLEVSKEKSNLITDCQKGRSRLQNMTSLPPRKPAATKGTPKNAKSKEG